MEEVEDSSSSDSRINDWTQDDVDIEAPQIYHESQPMQKFSPQTSVGLRPSKMSSEQSVGQSDVHVGLHKEMAAPQKTQ